MIQIFIQKMIAQHTHLDKQIQNLENILKQLPPGKLICTRNSKYFKWYHSYNHKLSYIPKSNRTFAEKLAQKNYLLLQLDDLTKQKSAIETFLKEYPQNSSNALQLLDAQSPYHELLSPHFSSDSPSLSDWASANYEKNPAYPEQCIHKSCSGNILRSKSETIIDSTLYLNKIPYRYECILNLAGKIFFPDFTIRHPETGNFYYWEHFGIMDNPDYSTKTFKKLQLYNGSNIIPTVNLITTYETQNHPLDSEYVQTLINYYFL